MESRSVRLLGKPGRRLYWVAGLLMIGAVVEADGLFAALGDLGNPARACAALAAQPALATSPKPFTRIGGTFSWWDITITGRLHGRPTAHIPHRNACHGQHREADREQCNQPPRQESSA